MKFDLFYELSLPEYDTRHEQQLYNDVLTELEHAEHCGFHTAWFAEHHFMPSYSHSSAPDLFLAAASQRTRKLRLGLGVIPLPFHHPVHVAERLATLDVLSGGRVDFGFGRGFSPREYAYFNQCSAESRSRTQEAYTLISQLLTGKTVQLQGKHYSLEHQRLIPTPVQACIPTWMAAVSPESFILAAELGLGVLAGPFKPWFMVKQDIKRYHGAWQHPQLIPQAAMTIGIHCLDDGKQARAEAERGFIWFYQQLLAHTRPLLQTLYQGYESYHKYKYLNGLLSRFNSLRALELLGLVIVGDPEHCLKRLSTLKNAGVSRVLCAIGAGALTHTQVKNSMETIGKKLIPQLETL